MSEYALVERALILNVAIVDSVAATLPTEATNVAQAILKGDYSPVLRDGHFFSDAGSTDDLVATGNIELWTETRLKSMDLDNLSTRFVTLATGIACLNAFIQTNWTGPLLDWRVSELVLDEADERLDKAIHAHCLESLSADSEPVYHLTERLGLLAIARTILLALRNKCATASFWAMRATFIQQQLLDNPTGSLQTLLTELASECTFDGTDDADLKIRLQLETALIDSYFGQDKEAYTNMQAAQKTSGFEWAMTGAMGRRTKFQDFDVSQLVLLAESSKKDEPKKETEGGKDEDGARPETVDLNDDTLLDSVAYSKTEENNAHADKRHGNLRVIDQCLLLAFCLNVKNTNPDHGLTSEEMAPYVTRVLENANNWMVHTMGLLLKTRLEAHKTRTVERSLLQLQALVDQIKVEDCGADERLAYFYDLLLPSKWEMERELAKRFVSLGIILSARDIFERLEMWEDVVSCYQMLEEPNKAKEVLSQLLAADPDSPKLLCILGDVEQNPDHWRKAWEVSGHHNARAMRTLGAYHYKRQEYKEAITCYQNALEINPLFEGSWYMLGCSAMQVDEWDIAVRAFQRVVALDHEQPEAWNNLASIHIHLGRKVDAFLALKQATKLKFDSWKIWQNMLFVSVDIGQFADAIWAMQRIVELRWDKVREEAVDTQVLQMLVDNVIQNWKDAFNRDGRRLARQVQRLLEDVILVRITNSPEIWRIVAKFYIWQGRLTDALEASIKAYRVVMHDVRIETDPKVFERVAQVALDTVDAYETLGEKEQDGTLVCADWRYQSKLIVKGLMGKVRDVFEDTEMYERLKNCLDDLKRA